LIIEITGAIDETRTYDWQITSQTLHNNWRLCVIFSSAYTCI